MFLREEGGEEKLKKIPKQNKKKIKLYEYEVGVFKDIIFLFQRLLLALQIAMNRILL